MNLRFGILWPFRNPEFARVPWVDLYKSHLDLISESEAMGYDNAWLTEHHFVDDGYSPSLMSIAGAISQRTTRMRIGTFLVLLPLHNPVRVAEDTATIDLMSNGRFDLGVGLGYRPKEFDDQGIASSERGGRLKEGVEIIQRLLSDEVVTFDGKYNHLKEVQQQKIPLILFDRIAKSIPSFRVIIDDQKAAFLATEHLIKQGCKNIAHFRGNLIPQMSIDRFIGYKKALELYNLPFQKEWCLVCEDDSFKNGYENAKKLLKITHDVDGLFSITDRTAIGAMNYFKKNGLKVPEDIAVIGFSNWKVSALTSPSLSSVEQNGVKMGKKVIELFIKTQKENKEEKKEFKTIKIPTKICLRESSMRTKT